MRFKIKQTKESLRNLFELFDENKDDFVDIEEFRKMMK
jgi:Ca2+-binding EF-hand superfamily protein